MKLHPSTTPNFLVDLRTPKHILEKQPYLQLCGFNPRFAPSNSSFKHSQQFLSGCRSQTQSVSSCNSTSQYREWRKLGVPTASQQPSIPTSLTQALLASAKVIYIYELFLLQLEVKDIDGGSLTACSSRKKHFAPPSFWS
jgi:hypothetical protein